jgi:hypothetical protein
VLLRVLRKEKGQMNENERQKGNAEESREAG